MFSATCYSKCSFFCNRGFIRWLIFCQHLWQIHSWRQRKVEILEKQWWDIESCYRRHVWGLKHEFIHSHMGIMVVQHQGQGLSFEVTAVCFKCFSTWTKGWPAIQLELQDNPTLSPRALLLKWYLWWISGNVNACGMLFPLTSSLSSNAAGRTRHKHFCVITSGVFMSSDTCLTNFNYALKSKQAG